MTETLLFVLLGALISTITARQLSPWIEKQHKPQKGFIGFRDLWHMPPEIQKQYQKKLLEARLYRPMFHDFSNYYQRRVDVPLIDTGTIQPSLSILRFMPDDSSDPWSDAIQIKRFTPRRKR